MEEWAGTLKTAVKGGDLDGCRQALFHRADPNAEVEWNDPESEWFYIEKGRLLHCALALGHLEVSKLLVVAGADLAAVDKDEWQPLHWVGRKGHTELAAGMLDRGAEIEAKGNDGSTPLSMAALSGHEETAKMLLDRGAHIETTDKDGWTPLIWAVANSHPCVVTLLLDRGADITCTDKWGNTAYDLSQRYGRAANLGPAVVARLKPPSPAAIAAADADAAEAASTAALGELRAGLRRAAVLSLAAFSVLARVGHRSHPLPTSRYYGCNSAVFRAVLRAAAAAVGGGGAAAAAVALKVIYNVHGVATNDMAEAFAADYAITEDAERQHPNVVSSLGHFVDTASVETLGRSWDADFVRPRTLFIMFEYLETSLQQLISARLAARNGGAAAQDGADAGAPAATSAVWPPVLTVEEWLVILQRLLRAVCHLLAHGIVHRDIKPDNILLATGVDGAPTDPASTPTIVKLADFGEALDTVADEIDDFKMPFINRDTPKGGAPAYLAPEVSSATPGSHRRMVFIDYSKNDVFAAGLVAHYMLTSGTGPDALQVPASGDRREATYIPPPDGCPQAIAELVAAMVNPSFEDRITANEALARVDALIDLPRLEWSSK